MSPREIAGASVDPRLSRLNAVEFRFVSDIEHDPTAGKECDCAECVARAIGDAFGA